MTRRRFNASCVAIGVILSPGKGEFVKYGKILTASCIASFMEK
jgi:hypothetical protein